MTSAFIKTRSATEIGTVQKYSQLLPGTLVAMLLILVENEVHMQYTSDCLFTAYNVVQVFLVSLGSITSSYAATACLSRQTVENTVKTGQRMDITMGYIIPLLTWVESHFWET